MRSGALAAARISYHVAAEWNTEVFLETTVVREILFLLAQMPAA
jgi:hypothetical protein